MKKLDNKVAIITGAGKGIGFGIAKAFAENGANLVITGRTQSTLDKAKEHLESTYGIRVLGVVGDGADESAVKNIIAKAVETFGKIDILVNNAQVSKSGVLLIDHSKEDFDLAINSGMYSTFFFMREAYPYLKENKGKVINFASGAGITGGVGQVSYAAAKEGIRGMSRVAAREWASVGINVNVVCPLAFTEGLEAWSKAYPEMYKKAINDIPMERFGDPKEDIGNVCVFLASDDSKYITGETISVQGGAGMRP